MGNGTVAGTDDSTYGGLIQYNVSLNKVGSSVLTLANVNTYTGNTTVSQGTLKLDFNKMASTFANILPSSSSLTLGGVSPALPLTGSTAGGAFLVVAGKNGSGVSQVTNGLILNPGASSITTTQIGTNGVLLNVGAITHNAGGTVNFLLAGSVVNNTNAIHTTTLNDATGILGGWAVYNGSSFATRDANGNIITYPVGSYTAATTSLADGVNTNVNITGTGGSLSLGSPTTTINTLRQGQATAATTVNLSAGQILRMGANGGILLPTGNQALTIGGTINQGTLTAGGTNNTPGEISITGFTNSGMGASAGQVVINTVIADNGTGATRLTIAEYAGTVGNDMVDLNGTNTYSGGTIITGGRVRAATSQAFGTGPVTVINGAQAYLLGSTYINAFNIAGSGTTLADTPSAIRLSGGQTLSGTLTLLGDSIIALGNTTGNVISGQITGSGSLTLAGQGTNGGSMTLSNPANNWTGNLRVDGERLILGSSNVLSHGAGVGNLILSNTSSSILDLNGTNQTINGLVSEGTAAFVLNSAVGTTSTLTIGAGDASASFGSKIIDNAGTGGVVALAKTGAGTQTLAAVNTFSGGLSVLGGTLISDVSGNALGSGTLTLGDTSGSANAALQMNNTGMTVTNPVIVAAGSSGSRALQTLGSGQSFIFSGPVTLNNTLTLNTFAGNTNTLAVTGNITGPSGLVVNAGGTAITLSGVNTYNGATTIGTGKLVAGSATALSSNSAFVLGGNSGAVLDLNNNASTIGSLAGGGSVLLGGVNLTLGGDGTSPNFAGVISGSGGLVKVGTGTQTLSGTNTYGGPTAINGGTLRVTGSLPNSSAVVVGTLGALAGTGSISGPVTLSGIGSAINLQDNAIGTLSLGGGLAMNAGNVLSFDVGSLSDLLSLTGGAFSFGGAGTATINIQNLSGFHVGTYNLITGANGILPAEFALSNSSVPGLSLALDVSGGNTLTLNVSLAAVYWNGSVNSIWNAVSAGTTNFGNIDGTVDASLVPTAAVPVIFSATNAQNESSTILGADIAIKTLTINTTNNVGIGGNNKLTIANAGGLTVNAGAGAVSITASQVALGVSQTWTNNSTNALTVSSTISGANALTLAGTGAITLTGNSTYSGGTILSPGTTLNINNGGSSLNNSAIGSGPFTINGGIIDNTLGAPVALGTNNAQNWNGDFTFAGSNPLDMGSGAVVLGGNRTVTVGGSTLTVGGVISGAVRSLTLVGPGTLVLGGGNTFGGGSTISSGTLQINNSSGLGTGPSSIAAAGTLVLNIGASNLSNTLSGAGTINVTPNGETRLRGNMSAFTGVINIGVNGAAKTDIDSSVVNINSAATINVASGGTLLVASNAGATTVAASINVSGTGNTENFGALRVDNGGTVSGAVTLLGNTSVGAQTGTGTISGSIGESGGSSGLTKVGAGTLVLSGANTFSGPTTVSAGVLTLANSLALQNSTLAGGSVLFGTVASHAFTLGGLSTSGNLALQDVSSNAIALSVGNSGNTTYGGVFSGSGSLVKTGSGTLTLNGTSTYTGGTKISGGILALGSSGALGTTGSLVFDSGTLQYSASNTVDYSARIKNSTTGPISIDTNGQTVAYASALDSSNTGGLTKLGTGTLTLSGTNTYTGATTLTGGMLVVNGSLGNTAVTVSGSSVLGGTGSIAGPVAVAGGPLASDQGAIDLRDGAIGTLTLSQGLRLGGTNFGDTSQVYFDLGLSGADRINLGSSVLTGTDGGFVINLSPLSGGFSHNGTFDLIDFASASGLVVGSNITLGSTPGGLDTFTLVLTSTALQLTVAGRNAPSIAYWTGAFGGSNWGGNNGSTLSTLTNWSSDAAGAVSTLQVPGSNTDIVFAAASSTPPSTVLESDYVINSLTVKAGFVAPVTISGTGALTIAAGASTGTSTLGYLPGTGIMLNAGSGGLTISTTGGVVLAASQTWTNNSGSVLSVRSNVSGPGALTLTGSGLVVLSGNNSYTGRTTAALGSNVQVGSGTALGSGPLTVGGHLDLNGNALVVGPLSGSSTGTITSSAAGPASISTTVASGASSAYSGVIQNGSGVVSLLKNGLGTLVMANSSSFTGGTTISAGILQLGDGSFNGSVGTGAIIDNDTLVINNGSAQTLTSNISGTGSVVMNGGFPATLAGTNTYSGSTTVNSSSLTVSSLGSGAVSIGGSGTLNLQTGSSTSYGNSFSGSGLLKVVFSGGNQTRLDNLGSFNGTIELASTAANANKWSAGTATVSGTSTLVIDSGSQLYLNGGSQTFSSIQVSGTGNTENRGAIRAQSGTLFGPVTLLGNATFGAEGGTIAGGISGGVIGAHTLTIGGSGNGNLTLSGSIGDGIGTLALLNSTAGITTLTGANTYSGGTTVSAGTLLVNNATGSGTGTGAVTVSNVGSVLGGIGTISGSTLIQSGASLMPGDPSQNGGIGTFTFGQDLTLDPSASIIFGLGAGGAARVVVGGQFKPNALSLLTVLLNYAPTGAMTFDLLDWNTPPSFASLSDLLDLPVLTSSTLYWDTSTFDTTGDISLVARAPDSLPFVQFAVKQARVREAGSADTVVTVAVQLDKVPTADVSVPITMTTDGILPTSGTATDFSVSASTVVIPAGQRSASFTVAVHDDAYAESTEHVVFSLGAPSGAVKGTQSTFTLTIDDNDSGYSLGDLWTLRNPQPTNETLSGVASLGTVMSAVGSTGTLLTSADNGVTWTKQILGTFVNLHGITANGSEFVAVGDGGLVVTSPDGILWTQRNAGGGRPLMDIVWTGTLFVAVGADGHVFTSANGADWDFQESGVTAALQSVVFAGGQLVAVGTGGRIITSNDGVTWTTATSGIITNLRSVASTGTLFVAAGDGGVMLTSSDGSVWTPVNSQTAANLLSVHWNGSLLIAAGDGGVLRTSSDGSTWAAGTSGVTSDLKGGALVGSQSILVGVGGTILASADGSTWTDRSTGPTDNLLATTWNGSHYVAVGASGRIVTSVTGDVWITQTSHTSQRLSGVAFKGSSQFVAVGDAGTVLSYDGTNWNNVSSPVSQNLNGVIAAGTAYCAVGNAGKVITSPNGTAWTVAAATNTTENLLAVAGNPAGSRWVAVGTNGAIITSTDASNWTNVTQVGVPALNSVVWAGTLATPMFIATGNNGTVLTSTDGLTWTRGSTGIASNITGLVSGSIPTLPTATPFAIAVTADGQAIRSSDGITWTKLVTGNGQPLSAIAWNNSRLAAVGAGGSIFTSDTVKAPKPAPYFPAISQTVVENAGVVNVVVNLSLAPIAKVTVPFTVTGNPASSTRYSVSTLPVIFNAGETSKTIAITVKSDSVVELTNEVVTLTLGANPSGNGSVGVSVLNTNQTFALTITDTVKPATALVPAIQHQMVPLGQSASLTALVTGTAPVVQWLKNGVAVPGALGATYTIPAMATTNAGKYTVKATNAAGSVTGTGYAELSVVDTTDRVVPALGASSPVITVVAAGDVLTYQWYRAGLTPGSDVALSDNSKYLNTKKAALTVKGLVAGDEGNYYCIVSQVATNLQLKSGNFNLLVAAKPTVTAVQNFPTPWTVSSPYHYQVLVDDTDLHTTPTKFTLTGLLPPGLTMNAVTGYVSGTPTTAGTYPFKITASNAAGASVVAGPYTIVVNNYPTTALGTFVGLIDRAGTATSLTIPADSAKTLGARFDLVTAKAGTFTGKVTVGSVIYTISGVLNTTPADPVGSFTIKRTGNTTLTGSFTLDATSELVSGTLSDGNATSAAISGWHAKPTLLAGRHNFIADSAAPTPGVQPEGASYASATVVAAGTTTVAGKTADGSVIATSAPVGPSGQVLVYQPLYTNTGSLTGIVTIASDVDPGTSAAIHTMGGGLTWTRATQASSVRTYQAGWAPLSLSVIGGFYHPAPALPLGAIVMNLPQAVGNNAQLTFGGGGIEGSSVNPDCNFRINTVSAIVKPGVNPGAVVLTAVNNTTGAFNGTFSLSDTVASVVVKRTSIAFQGLIIPHVHTTDSSVITTNPFDGIGHGYFLLPQLPAPTTGPILSGQVNLQKFP